MPADSNRFQDLSSFSVAPGFRGRSAAFVQLWWCVNALLFRLSPQFAYGFRAWLLRIFGATIGRGVKIRPTAVVTYPWKLHIGDHCQIGDDAVLYSLGEIWIGPHTVVSQRSYICAADHDYGQIDFPLRAKRVEIGSECWISTDVFVAPGVSIGDGTVVGARSTVFKDLGAGVVAYGTPAVAMRSRLPSLQTSGVAD